MSRVGTIYECIETNLWLADAYYLRGARRLALECLESAWNKYLSHQEELQDEDGEALRDRIIASLVQKGGEEAAEIAFRGFRPQDARRETI